MERAMLDLSAGAKLVSFPAVDRSRTRDFYRAFSVAPLPFSPPGCTIIFGGEIAKNLNWVLADCMRDAGFCFSSLQATQTCIECWKSHTFPTNELIAFLSSISEHSPILAETLKQHTRWVE